MTRFRHAPPGWQPGVTRVRYTQDDADLLDAVGTFVGNSTPLPGLTPTRSSRRWLGVLVEFDGRGPALDVDPADLEVLPAAGPMTAAQAAAVIRHLLPDVSRADLLTLMYHANGHHLLWNGNPLFAEPLREWTDEVLYGTAAGFCGLDNGLLNTIGYVCSPSFQREAATGRIRATDPAGLTAEQLHRRLRHTGDARPGSAA